MRQLALALKLPTDAGFNNFLPGPNLETLEAVKQLSLGKGEHFLTLWGHTGTGKSHLLQAACRDADRHQRSAFYLSLAASELPPPELLTGMETMDLVAIDDIDAISGNREWEEALYQLYNAIREGGGELLVSSSLPLNEIPLSLPDLKSRLSWGPIYHLNPLADHDLATVLRSQAEQIGLTLQDEILKFLLTREQRDLSKLLDLLNQLDQASLEAKRKLTLPFVREWLARS